MDRKMMLTDRLREIDRELCFVAIDSMHLYDILNERIHILDELEA